VKYFRSNFWKNDVIRALLVMSAATALGGSQTWALPGDLDTKFGLGGKVTTNIGTVGADNRGNAAAIQSDGKIVVAGATTSGNASNSQFAVVRYNANGSLDSSFGSGGVVATDITNREDYANAVVVQPDKKIVIAGSAHGRDDDFAVVRYNSNGSLDTAFGSGGKVITNFGLGYGNFDNDVARALLLQGSKIVVVGYSNSFNYGQGTSSSGFAMVRYNANGSVDTTFGDNGKEFTPMAGLDVRANAAVLQTDGKIVAAGTNSSDFVVARFESNGNLDTTFGTAGVTKTDFHGKSDVANALLLQRDGKFVATGSAGNNSIDIALARYNANGSLDTTFDSDGKVSFDALGNTDEAHAIAIQGDSKIVVAGLGRTGVDFTSIAVRFNANGSVDSTFDSGLVFADFDGYDDYFRALAIQGDGKIVAAGFANGSANFDVTVARFNTNGVRDAGFGTDGKVRTQWGSVERNDRGQDTAIQRDGKIVVVGDSYGINTPDFAVARYNANGSLDTSFGESGRVITRFNGTGAATAVTVQSDGKILVAGNADILLPGETNGLSHVALVRYNANGSLDTSFGEAGKVLTRFSQRQWLCSLAIQKDQKIVAMGYSLSPNITFDLTVLRFNSDGAPDTNFGNAGVALAATGSDAPREGAVALQEDGKIVAAGFGGSTGNYDFALVRFTTGGTLDTSFGTTG